MHQQNIYDPREEAILFSSLEEPVVVPWSCLGKLSSVVQINTTACLIVICKIFQNPCEKPKNALMVVV